LSEVTANGAPTTAAPAYGLGEPNQRFDVAIIAADIAFQTFPITTFEIDPLEARVVTNPEAYSTGTFYREFITVFTTGVFNITNAIGMVWGVDAGSGNEIAPLYRIRLTTPFTKTSSQILTLNLRTTVGRLLVN
jgi:hypothetical protein